MYPFPSLALLATDVQHVQLVRLEIKLGLDDTRCTSATAENVLSVERRPRRRTGVNQRLPKACSIQEILAHLFRGRVAWVEEPIQVRKEAEQRGEKIELSAGGPSARWPVTYYARLFAIATSN